MKRAELVIVDQHRTHLLRAHTKSRHRLRLVVVGVDTHSEEKDVDVVPGSVGALIRIVSQYPDSMLYHSGLTIFTSSCWILTTFLPVFPSALGSRNAAKSPSSVCVHACTASGVSCFFRFS